MKPDLYTKLDDLYEKTDPDKLICETGCKFKHEINSAMIRCSSCLSLFHTECITVFVHTECITVFDSWKCRMCCLMPWWSLLRRFKFYVTQ